MKESRPRFPVIILKNDSVGAAKNYDQLRICNQRGLSSGAFDQMRVVGIDGKRYTITSAKFGSFAKRWWERPLFLTLIYADLGFAEDGDVKLPELRQMLLKAYKADQAFWDEAWGEYKEFVAALEKCLSIEDVAKMFP